MRPTVQYMFHSIFVWIKCKVMINIIIIINNNINIQNNNNNKLVRCCNGDEWLIILGKTQSSCSSVEKIICYSIVTRFFFPKIKQKKVNLQESVLSDLLLISPILYERICANMYSCSKKVQTKYISTKKLRAKLAYKKLRVKCWWNWQLGTISPTFYVQLLRQ